MFTTDPPPITDAAPISSIIQKSSCSTTAAVASIVSIAITAQVVTVFFLLILVLIYIRKSPSNFLEKQFKRLRGLLKKKETAKDSAPSGNDEDGRGTYRLSLETTAATHRSDHKGRTYSQDRNESAMERAYYDQDDGYRSSFGTIIPPPSESVYGHGETEGGNYHGEVLGDQVYDKVYISEGQSHSGSQDTKHHRDIEYPKRHHHHHHHHHGGPRRVSHSAMGTDMYYEPKHTPPVKKKKKGKK